MLARGQYFFLFLYSSYRVLFIFGCESTKINGPKFGTDDRTRWIDFFLNVHRNAQIDFKFSFLPIGQCTDWLHMRVYVSMMARAVNFPNTHGARMANADSRFNDIVFLSSSLFDDGSDASAQPYAPARDCVCARFCINSIKYTKGIFGFTYNKDWFFTSNCQKPDRLTLVRHAVHGTKSTQFFLSLRFGAMRYAMRCTACCVCMCSHASFSFWISYSAASSFSIFRVLFVCITFDWKLFGVYLVVVSVESISCRRFPPTNTNQPTTTNFSIRLNVHNFHRVTVLVSLSATYHTNGCCCRRTQCSICFAPMLLLFDWVFFLLLLLIVSLLIRASSTSSRIA